MLKSLASYQQCVKTSTRNLDLPKPKSQSREHRECSRHRLLMALSSQNCLVGHSSLPEIANVVCLRPKRIRITCEVYDNKRERQKCDTHFNFADLGTYGTIVSRNITSQFYGACVQYKYSTLPSNLVDVSHGGHRDCSTIRISLFSLLFLEVFIVSTASHRFS